MYVCVYVYVIGSMHAYLRASMFDAYVHIYINEHRTTCIQVNESAVQKKNIRTRKHKEYIYIYIYIHIYTFIYTLTRAQCLLWGPYLRAANMG